jgi:hypothetical protein
MYRTKVDLSVPKKNYSACLSRKLKSLVWHLRFCHEQLIYLQNSKAMSEIPDAMMKFIQWLYMILFKPEDDRLPIFGDVEIDESNLTSLKVGPVQKYIINDYLSPQDSHFKVVQVSLALLGYWYQEISFTCIF